MGFTEEERKLLVREVKKLTIDAVMNQEKILKEDLEALKRLENCREEIEKLLYQDVSIDRIIDSILTLLKGNSHKWYSTICPPGKTCLYRKSISSHACRCRLLYK